MLAPARPLEVDLGGRLDAERRVRARAGRVVEEIADQRDPWLPEHRGEHPRMLRRRLARAQSG